MAGASKIEWTDATWNPIVGCSIVSPGCTNCYAMRDAWRKHHIPAMPHYRDLTKKVNGNAVWTGKLAMAPDSILLAPLKRKKPTKYFVNSMGDLFHEDCPDEWIDKVFAVMALAPQHTFQVLTKRADRMHRYLTNADQHEASRRDGRYTFTVVQRVQALVADFIRLGKFQVNGFGPVYKEYMERAKPHLRPLPLPNVWLGVSTERQHEADDRIPLLLQTPAAVRFISAEPLLGPIDLTALAIGGDYEMDCLSPVSPKEIWDAQWDPALTDVPLDESIEGFEDEGFTYPPSEVKPRGLDWVIAGGESGPKARPSHPDWIRSLRDQCAAAGVAFHFKQWGEWSPSTPEAASGNPQSGWKAIAAYPHVAKADELYPDAGAAFIERVGKKKAGRLLDGVEHNEFPKARAL